jgi:hypothetical protein
MRNTSPENCNSYLSQQVTERWNPSPEKRLDMQLICDITLSLPNRITICKKVL